MPFEPLRRDVFVCVGALALLVWEGQLQAAELATQAAAQVLQLADEYVAHIRERFPSQYNASGLPNPRRDILDQNSPAQFAQWREIRQTLERRARAVDVATLGDRSERLTLALLLSMLRSEAVEDVCRRLEYWNVRMFGWPATLSVVAELQPLGSPQARSDILQRFGAVPGFADQEIANLRDGLKAGYSAPRTVVDRVIAQLDQLVATPIDGTPLISPAVRDPDEAFGRQWRALLTDQYWPALRRYRDFLASEYAAHARRSASVADNPSGAACYRAFLSAHAGVDIEPKALFDRILARSDAEAAFALDLARKHYGRRFADLRELAGALRADPQNRFADAEALRTFIERTIAHSRANAHRVFTKPTDRDIQIKAFPEYSSDDGPGGMYVPADQDGRVPTYYYRSDVVNIRPATLEATVLHETWPGHHMEIEAAAQHVQQGGHPIAQLAYVMGYTEGWATYIEALAREMRLYSSDLSAMGSVMDSLAPWAVVDIGIHVLGWNEQQAYDFVSSRLPLKSDERLRTGLVSTTDEPGFVLPYVIGAMTFDDMREEAQGALGRCFDLPAFHSMLLSQGAAPFPVLRERLAKWSAAKESCAANSSESAR